MYRASCILHVVKEKSIRSLIHAVSIIVKALIVYFSDCLSLVLLFKLERVVASAAGPLRFQITDLVLRAEDLRVTACQTRQARRQKIPRKIRTR